MTAVALLPAMPATPEQTTEGRMGNRNDADFVGWGFLIICPGVRCFCSSWAKVYLDLSEACISTRRAPTLHHGTGFVTIQLISCTESSKTWDLQRVIIDDHSPQWLCTTLFSVSTVQYTHIHPSTSLTSPHRSAGWRIIRARRRDTP